MALTETITIPLFTGVPEATFIFALESTILPSDNTLVIGRFFLGMEDRSRLHPVHQGLNFHLLLKNQG